MRVDLPKTIERQVSPRTWVHPLHAKGKAVRVRRLVVVDSQGAGWNRGVCVGHGAVCVDVVASPWGLDVDGMRGGMRPVGGRDDELCKMDHGCN